MYTILLNAQGYLSPVRLGSGMKTKVAEAMSYSLPVLATEHSLIGYEQVSNSDYIVKYEGVDDIDSTIIRNLIGYSERYKILADFKAYFSTDSSVKAIERLLS